MMRSKPWWLPSLLLALVLPLLGSHSAVPAPHPDFDEALWIAESDRGLKVALSDGRVLFEIPDTGRIEALIVNEEAAVLWAYGEGQLLSYDFAGRRLLALPIDGKSADRHSRSKRTHLALNPLDGSLWLGVDRQLYHVDHTGELLQETQLQDPIRALSFDRTRTRLWVGFRRSLTAYDASGTPGQRIDIGRSGRSAISPTMRRSMLCGWHSRTGEYSAMRPRAVRSKSMRTLARRPGGSPRTTRAEPGSRRENISCASMAGEASDSSSSPLPGQSRTAPGSRRWRSSPEKARCGSQAEAPYAG